MSYEESNLTQQKSETEFMLKCPLLFTIYYMVIVTGDSLAIFPTPLHVYYNHILYIEWY